MNFFNMMSKLFDNASYKRNPNPINLSKEQFAEINLGAINAEQTGYYCDSLSTGADLSGIAENLNDYYGIYDRESAIETLLWLLNQGHHIFFNLIKEGMTHGEEGIDTSDLSQEVIDALEEYTNNIKESLDELADYDFMELKQLDDLLSKNIIAWDMGRLVLVTRCCYECGYLNEVEAWKFLDQAYQISIDTYDSWQEFGAGYALGRAMWSGNNLTLTGILEITKGLLEDENSPWRQYPFK